MNIRKKHRNQLTKLGMVIAEVCIIFDSLKLFLVQRNFVANDNRTRDTENFRNVYTPDVEPS